MNLAIVGYGKMGRLVEQLAPEYGFEVKQRLNRANNASFEGLTEQSFRGIDTAIEFSSPAAAPENIIRLARLGVNVVTGTTGWTGEIARVQKAVEEAGVACVWGSNFSIGVHVFTQIIVKAGELLEAESDYGAWAWEIHHAAKKDAPSGTLKALVEALRRSGYTRRIDESSSRAGSQPGTHEIGWDSPGDTIVIRHTARSRDGFARGALRAARWLAGRKGFFDFRDVVSELD